MPKIIVRNLYAVFLKINDFAEQKTGVLFVVMTSELPETVINLSLISDTHDGIAWIRNNLPKTLELYSKNIHSGERIVHFIYKDVGQMPTPTETQFWCSYTYTEHTIIAVSEKYPSDKDLLNSNSAEIAIYPQGDFPLLLVDTPESVVAVND